MEEIVFTVLGKNSNLPRFNDETVSYIFKIEKLCYKKALHRMG